MLADTRTRLKRTSIVALPMVVSQASEAVMLFVDRLFLSRVGKVELAAAMTGGITNFMLCSFFTGVVGYVNALVAQYYGAKRSPMCARSTTQALYLAAISYPILLLFIPLGGPFFRAMGQDPAQVVQAEAYLRILLSGSILLVGRFAFASFFVGIGRTKMVMIANLAGMVVNVPANYLFVFGRLGLPALGIRGAAIGTLCGHLTTTLLLAVAYLLTISRPPYRAEGLWRPDRSIAGRLLKFGLPAGAEQVLNVSAFNLFIQLMHSYGSDVAAAVTIAFNYDIVAFIPMLGLGIATTAMVGNDIGARDPDGAVRTARLSIRLAYVYGAAMITLYVFGAPALVEFFSSGFSEHPGETERLAVLLLRLAAIYVLADSTQLVFSGALRGAGDTAWVMRFSIVVHWVLAGAAFLLIRVIAADPVVVWTVFIAVIITLGVAMYLRWRSGAWRRIKLIEV